MVTSKTLFFAWCKWEFVGGGVGTNSLLPPRELMVLWPNHTTSLPRRPHFHFLSVKNWPILFTLCSNKIAIFTPMKVHKYYKKQQKTRKRMTSLCHQLWCAISNTLNTINTSTSCDNISLFPCQTNSDVQSRLVKYYKKPSAPNQASSASSASLLLFLLWTSPAKGQA